MKKILRFSFAGVFGDRPRIFFGLGQIQRQPLSIDWKPIPSGLLAVYFLVVWR